MRAHFSKGDQVEVEIKGEAHTDPNNTVYYAATVLRPPAIHKNLIFIEYHTLTEPQSDGAKRVKEYVDLGHVRPAQPRELNSCFKVGDDVDAYQESNGCWLRGNVSHILENSRYVVSFDGKCQEIEVDHWNLRLHREWDDGSWVPPLREQDMSSEMEVKPRKVRLKITCVKQKSPAKFEKQTIVEVSSDEEGYKGSWYSALIVDSIGIGKFLVEYLTLKADDETTPLREEIEAQYIRPCPPELSPVVQFKPLEQVDAWYNDGWWVGVVSRVLNGLKYIVYFRSANEELEFGHSNLRLHQDWIDGKWVISSQEKSNSQLEVKKSKGLKLKFRLNERKANAAFTKGMKVEVRSDEQGYEGSWYSAVIINLIGNDKYLVEYQTLKTDDETDFLREVANALDVRPYPPCIQRVCRYELFEYVDAWYNDGWWVGQIYKVLAGLRYAIYFRTTNEELEFEHCNLRPHQEWTDGKWVVASRIGNFDCCLKC